MLTHRRIPYICCADRLVYTRDRLLHVVLMLSVGLVLRGTSISSDNPTILFLDH